MNNEDGDQQGCVPSYFDENRSFLFLLSRRLQELQNSYERHGLLTSLHYAIELIRDSGELETPEWILNGALKVIGDRLVNPKPIQKGGPSGNELSKQKIDLRRFRRWLLVRGILKSGLIKTKKEAFVEASKRLKSHGEYTVSADAVEKAYYRIEKEKNDPTQKWKYQPPMFKAAKLTGTVPGSDVPKE